MRRMRASLLIPPALAAARAAQPSSFRERRRVPMRLRLVFAVAGVALLGAAAPVPAQESTAAATLAEATPPAAALLAARRHAAPAAPAAVDLTEISRRPAVTAGAALIRLPRGCDYLAPVDGKLVCRSAAAR
jgi:hypothetical protein